MKLPRLTLLTVVALSAMLASCDRGPGSAQPLGPTALKRTSNLLGLDLLACTPMSADSATAAIGPEGGTINVGPHSLIVPAGALDSTVTITAIAPSDSINRVEFYPNGLQFAQPATLVMSYANCGFLGGLPLHRVAYIDGSLNILDILPSIDNVFALQATTQLHHFSDYAIAW